MRRSHNITSDFAIKGIQGVEKTEYPLTVVVGPGRQLHLSLSYQTEHFNEELIKDFQIISNRFSEESFITARKTLQTLSLLTQAEEHQLLIEWNDKQHKYGLSGR